MVSRNLKLAKKRSGKNFKRADAERFIDERLDNARTLQALNLLRASAHKQIGDLLNVNSQDRSRDQKHLLRSLYLLANRIDLSIPIFIDDARREQEYLLIPEFQRVGAVRYRYLCAFQISPVDLASVRGYEKLVKLGFYHSTANVGGVVRDHRLSIKDGFDLKLPPEIVGHPCNCEFLTVAENLAKSSDSSISLLALQTAIEKWNASRGVKTVRWKKFEEEG